MPQINKKNIALSIPWQTAQQERNSISNIDNCSSFMCSLHFMIARKQNKQHTKAQADKSELSQAFYNFVVSFNTSTHLIRLT
jgi:hypothetical protein